MTLCHVDIELGSTREQDRFNYSPSPEGKCRGQLE